MKCKSEFKDFLEKEVNLNATRISRLDGHVEAITDLLKDCEKFSEFFEDIIPQGSYAHKTIIKPVWENHEFDADCLFQLKEVPGWQPKDYVEELYKFFKDHGTYKDKVSRKTRCVTLNYTGDFHLDIVPFLLRHGQHYVTNRHENGFELTNPEGFNAWLDERNRITNNNFIKVVRLLKYLRDFKGTFTIKSILLSTLLGERVNEIELLVNPDCYCDIPTALYTIAKSLKNYLNANVNMPAIMDPGQTGENFGDRWDQGGYENFRKCMMGYADKIVAAFDEADKQKSIDKWRTIFGDEFGKCIKDTKSSSDRSLVEYDNTEQHLSDLEIDTLLNPSYKVRIEGVVRQGVGFRSYKLVDKGNKVRKGCSIDFTVVKCNVPQPYDIYWKVLNRGDEAKNRNSIRGQIFPRGETINERTQFSGPHYVECFIVKDGTCLASDKQRVEIM